MGKVLSALFIFFLIPQIVLADAGGGTIEFIENRGQWEAPFLYKATTVNSDIYLEATGFTYVLGSPQNAEVLASHKTRKKQNSTLYFHAYKMKFVGASISTDVRSSKLQQHYYNYYLGSNPQRWHSGIHPAGAVDYYGIYKNVDLHISSESSNVKYDFIVHPGGDASAIRLRFEGVNGLSLKNNKLQIATSVGVAEEMAPYAYQYIDDKRVEVVCKYRISESEVSYIFPNGYDKTKPLVIDPTVVFATFTGSRSDNWGFTATYDPTGNFYAGGIVNGGNYPTTIGAYSRTYAGGGGSGSAFPCDIAISKFNAVGSALLYSTYLGGEDNEQPHSLVVDQAGNLYLAGRTYSSDFPVNGYDTNYHEKGDIIVAKFNATGTSLLGSTYIGGEEEDGSNFTSDEFGHGNLKHNYGDDARSEIILDNAGNVYVAACTKSDTFPTTANAIKTTKAATDSQDAVVFKLNTNLTTLIWSTYLGGKADDAAYVLTLDNTQTTLYVAGGTMSDDFPTTAGAYATVYGDNIDGFITKFQNGGNYPIINSTYIGTGGYDQCYGLQMDANNNVYAMGQTMGGAFPVSAGVYSNPGSSQFIIELNNNLSTNVRSTVYGSGTSSATNISPVAFLIDTCGNIYVSGWGGDLFTSAGETPPAGTGNTFGMPTGGIAGPAAQPTTDGEDFYFIVLSKNMASLLYATFMGASGGVGEHVDGGTSRFDKNGTVYQAICGGCSQGTFPTTVGAWSTTNPGPNCNLVALKIAFNFGAVNAGASISPNRVLCVGEAATFNNSSVNATSYLWDFGDGTTSTAQTPPPKSYANPGTYTVRLTIYNPAACVERDTSYLTVTVDTNNIKSSFTSAIIDTCSPFRASFTNTSKFGKNPANASFFWDFGDGTTYTGNTPPVKNFPGGGTYTVKLVMTDPTACNSPDSSSVILTFRDDSVKAGLEVPALICVSDSFRPTNTSKNAVTYQWDFGDGNTSAALGPAHKYDTAGTYTVSLWAYNPTTCNKVDSVSMTITVKESPIADFTYVPLVPITNEPHVFTNRSVNAVRFNWNFGDGTGTEENNPTHLYKKSGTYNVCLVAYNQEGCTDTVCKPVTADIYPVADLPTAFSPNGDGKNDILFVRGAGVQSMNLKIYNRWGQLVFESNSLDVGWDGTYKGKKQEMEAYAYVLNVTFTDETTLYKRGNVTLLR